MKQPATTLVNAGWQAVCHARELQMHAGVAVRAHGRQVAIFLTDEGMFAIDHIDPFSGAAILARGIVGDLQGTLVVASPMYKQHFCLRTGRCLEDDGVCLRTWPLRQEKNGAVSIGLPGLSTQKENRHAIAA